MLNEQISDIVSSDFNPSIVGYILEIFELHLVYQTTSLAQLGAQLQVSYLVSGHMVKLSSFLGL